MIEISVLMGKKGPLSIEVKGHSGYAPEGEDIVCAAVSTLMYALLLGLKEVIGICDITSEINDEIPKFSILWKEKNMSGDRARAVINTILKSLKYIAGAYPKYVHIVEVNKS